MKRRVRGRRLGGGGMKRRKGKGGCGVGGEWGCEGGRG